MNIHHDEMAADSFHLNRRYIERYFLVADELADAVALTVQQVDELIAGGCSPGPVYVIGDHKVWSALERQPQPSGTRYYSPGAAWGLRRAAIAIRSGATPTEAAQSLQHAFEDAFVEALGKIEEARLAFGACFIGGAVDAEAARRIARSEWGDWLNGGYPVCLRVFNGWNCVAKESLRAYLRAALEKGDYDPAQLISKAEALASLLLPFAPYQRSKGTPGLIDRLLKDQDLGDERPYAKL